MVPEPETREQRAERLAPTAAEWVTRLRDEDVNTLAAELLDPLPRRDLYGLIGLLGGAADPSVPASAWWGWVRHRDVLAGAEPIRWADDELRIEDMTSAQINQLISRLATDRHLSDAEIAQETGLSHDMVAKRRERMKLPPALRRGDVRTARAGVAG